MVNTKRPKKTKTIPARYQQGFISKLDGRERVVKQLQRSFTAILDDLGGADSLSYLAISLAERLVFLEYKIKEYEASLLAGELKEADFPRYAQFISTYMGLCGRLGLERRDPTEKMNLTTYLAERNAS